MKKKIIAVTTITASLLLLAGCDGGGRYYYGDGILERFPGNYFGGNYVYDSIVEQDFKDVSEEPSSYFSLDRNTANYSMVRAQINAGQTVAYDSVRIEELVNYFHYDYPAPEEGEEMAATAYLSDCPWNEANKLLTVGIRTEERVVESAKNNYVFLIDVSGSMSAGVRGTDKSCLELVQYGIGKLVEGLGENDRVSVATYASGVRTALEPTLATESGKKTIMRAVNRLKSNGATNGAGGLELAYTLAERYYSADGNNRVILLTDGDFNVGMRDTEEMEAFIRGKAQSGVYLSVLGVGLGNMRDDLMQTLALAGNGNYGYIDSEREAEKILSEELNGMLFTVAKDAKAGVTFSDMVSRYRIIGYDMKLLSEDDFNDESKDAGEIGSNLTVTAMYELELNEEAAEGVSLADVEIRFKSAETGESRSVTTEVLNADTGTDDTAFAACVAEFGLILRKSDYKGTASLRAVLSRLEALADYISKDEYKEEFQALVERARNSKNYGK